MKSNIQKEWQKKWDTADTGIFYYKINSSVNEIKTLEDVKMR